MRRTRAGAEVSARRDGLGGAHAGEVGREGRWDGVGAARLGRERALYRGEWRRGAREGVGALEQETTGVRFEGVFKGDAACGPGRKLWPSGASFVGDFDVRGAPSGRGMYQNLAGDTTCGEFSEGRCNGLGKTFFVNGDCYVGAFKDGKPHGLGEKTIEGVSTSAGPKRGEWVSGALSALRDDQDAELCGVIEAAEAAAEGAMAFCEEVQQGLLMRVRDVTLQANALCVAAREELGLDVDDYLYEACKRAPKAGAAQTQTQVQTQRDSIEDPAALSPAATRTTRENTSENGTGSNRRKNASPLHGSPTRVPRRPAPRPPPDDDGAASETMSFATATWQESIADGGDAGEIDDDGDHASERKTNSLPSHQHQRQRHHRHGKRDHEWDSVSMSQRSSLSSQGGGQEGEDDEDDDDYNDHDDDNDNRGDPTRNGGGAYAVSEADLESLPAAPAVPRAPSNPEAHAAMQASLSRLRKKGGSYLPSPFAAATKRKNHHGTGSSGKGNFEDLEGTDSDEDDEDGEYEEFSVGGPRRPGSAPALAGSKLLSIRDFISSKFAGQMRLKTTGANQQGEDENEAATAAATAAWTQALKDAGVQDRSNDGEDDGDMVLSARQYALLWKSLNPARGSSGPGPAAMSMRELAAGFEAGGWDMDDADAHAAVPPRYDKNRAHSYGPEDKAKEKEEDEEEDGDDFIANNDNARDEHRQLVGGDLHRETSSMYESSRQGRGDRASIGGASSLDPRELRPPMHPPPPPTVSTLASERGDTQSDSGTTMSYLAPPSHPPPSVAGSEMTWDSDALGAGLRNGHGQGQEHGRGHRLFDVGEERLPRTPSPRARNRMAHRAKSSSTLRAKVPPQRPKTAPPLAPLRPPYPPRRPPLPPADPHAPRPPARPPLPPVGL
ncbi:Phosphatidylinositol 4-phosphate 5-kinase 5 [Hondaea fermentalgiana]|uniref:Phosphatidylinositol 4-phosphate 5-kinase 5 n=1 Tax=Hondaea fermentalgiana TaxID=2315210 RepID=A0A2R5GUB3_9STRA|nr:Phosphatidylinositol 4-phosphate 5-kinase 5 [Hondaea fermentalgiana]|eukprot:GBG31484.1 Phosphatidylinositol 4-phosphate 5-kinase 5 [Hondaea fermentalgiana]